MVLRVLLAQGDLADLSTSLRDKGSRRGWSVKRLSAPTLEPRYGKIRVKTVHTFKYGETSPLGRRFVLPYLCLNILHLRKVSIEMEGPASSAPI